MSTQELERPVRPTLLIFEDARSGYSRRAEGALAQVLQHHRNHDVFQIIRVDINERPELAERFAIETDPTLLVIDNRRIESRLERPKNAPAIHQALARWLR